MDFNSLKSPFLGFQVIQTGYWPELNLESVFIIKSIFTMKYLTDFRKKVETGVDPRLFRIGGLEERKCWRVVKEQDFHWNFLVNITYLFCLVQFSGLLNRAQSGML